MIGVAFGLRETFGAADVERLAFARVAAQVARAYDADDEAAIVQRIDGMPDAAFASPAAVRDVVSAMLGGALSAGVSLASVEGLVQGAGTHLCGERFVPTPGVGDVLRALAELNVPRAGLSLGWPGVDRRKADAAGFDGEIVYASHLHADDGALAPFVRIAEALRLPVDRIFFVGTEPHAELQPAAVAGMRTVRLARDGAPYPADLLPPAFTIATLEELLPIVSGPYTQGLLALRHIMRTALAWQDGRYVARDARVLPDPPEG